MPKTIGGTISSQGVKTVADNSAFAAGGSGGASILDAKKNGGFTVTNSGWDQPDHMGTHINTGSSGRNVWHTGRPNGANLVKLADNIHMLIWRSGTSRWHHTADQGATGTDGKIKAAIITHNASGIPSFGAMQELNDFTISWNGNVKAFRVSDTRVLVVQTRLSTDNVVRLDACPYDISGDTITKMTGASVQADAMVCMAPGSQYAYSYNSNSFGAIIVNGDSAILNVIDYYRDYHSTAGSGTYTPWSSGQAKWSNAMRSIKFTPTQSLGSYFRTQPYDGSGIGVPLVDGAYTYPWGASYAYQYGRIQGFSDGAMHPDPGGTRKFYSINAHGFHSWPYSAASPPVISAPTHEQRHATSATAASGDNFYFMTLDNPASSYESVVQFVPPEHRSEYFEHFDSGTLNGHHYSGLDTHKLNKFGPCKDVNTIHTSGYGGEDYPKRRGGAEGITYVDKVGDTHRLLGWGQKSATGVNAGFTKLTCFNFTPGLTHVAIGGELIYEEADYPLDPGGDRYQDIEGIAWQKIIRPTSSSTRFTILKIVAGNGQSGYWDDGDGAWVSATFDVE